MSKLVSQSPSSCCVAPATRQPDVRGASPGNATIKDFGRGNAGGVVYGWLSVFLIALCAAQSSAQLTVQTKLNNEVQGDEPVVTGVEWTGGIIPPPPNLAPYLRRDAPQTTQGDWWMQIPAPDKGLLLRGDGLTMYGPGGFNPPRALTWQGYVKGGVMSTPDTVYPWPSGASSPIATMSDIEAAITGFLNNGEI